MSATIKYKQVKDTGVNLAVSTPSSFIKAFRNAGLELPCELESKDIAMLQGMSAVTDEDNNEYKRLITAIENLEHIEVYSEY